MKFCPEDILFGQTEKETIMEKIIKWCDEKISFLKQNKIQFVNGIPVIPEEMLYSDIPDMIDTFAHRNEIPAEIAKKSLVSYFDDDTNLINRLLNVDNEISVLRQYSGICGFDLRQHRTEIARQISSIIFCQIDKIDAGILTYFKEILAKMTENLPIDGVQSRQAVAQRCCLKSLCYNDETEAKTKPFGICCL